MATLRQAKKAVTREKVLQSAKTCFGTLGYERATIRDIANTAGVSTGSVFSNFKDKVDLYRAVHGHAPITPEHGRALLLAARISLNVPGPHAEQLGAAIAQAEEA